MSDGEGGSKLKAFLADKGVDAILIPVGLFAALWFQNWVDERKDRESYAETVSDFETELRVNLGKAKSLENDVGPMVEEVATLGPMGEKFETFISDAKWLGVSLQCVNWQLFGPNGMLEELKSAIGPDAAAAASGPSNEPENVAVGELAADATQEVGAAAVPSDPSNEPENVAAGELVAEPTQDGQAEAAAIAEADAAGREPQVAAGAEGQATELTFVFPSNKAERDAYCKKLMDEDKGEKPPPAVDLSPFYRKVVWQVYTSSSIKLFKDPSAKQLGLLLGEVYAAQDEVERRVTEIERIFNDSIMSNSASLTAMIGELDDVFGSMFSDEDKPSEQAFAEARERIEEMVERTIETRYAIETTRKVVELKVLRLKEYIRTMNSKLEGAIKALEAEKARLS